VDRPTTRFEEVDGDGDEDGDENEREAGLEAQRNQVAQAWMVQEMGMVMVMEMYLLNDVCYPILAPMVEVQRWRVS